MTDGFDLIVHSFDGAVREAQLGPGKDSMEVGAEEAHEFLEWLQT